MASEETSLLTSERLPNVVFDHGDAYNRFTPLKKAMILAMVSFCGLLPLLISGSFVPLIPQIANDLHSTGSVVSLAFSVSVFAAGLGSLFGGSYSTYYGRRLVYIYGLCLLCVGSIGVALASSVHQLMFWRFFQTFGASPPLAVGAGVIGDIYRLEERGTAMGIFLMAVLLGPTLAPLAGGLAAYYASWRIMQLVLAVSGVLALACVIAFFPETMPPNTRGIDKKCQETGRRWSFEFINPLTPLWLLRSPLLMGVCVSSSLLLLTDFAMLTPLVYTIGLRYNIQNEVILGACFLPNGLGDCVGAPLAGRISDYLVVKYKARRGGVWCPEDRLRVSLYAAWTIVPLSALFFGLCCDFVGGNVGLALTLVCLFANGVGVQMVLGPSMAYLVDVMHTRSAESVAANSGFRSWLISAALIGVLPLIDSIGIAATYAIAAALAWVGYVILWLIIRYGDRIRASNDVGFTKAEDN